MNVRKWVTRRLRYGDLRALEAIASGTKAPNRDQVKRLIRRRFVVARGHRAFYVTMRGRVALMIRSFTNLDEIGFDRPSSVSPAQPETHYEKQAAKASSALIAASRQWNVDGGNLRGRNFIRTLSRMLPRLRIVAKTRHRRSVHEHDNRRLTI